MPRNAIISEYIKMQKLSIEPEKVHALVDYLMSENYKLTEDFKKQDSITKVASYVTDISYF